MISTKGNQVSVGSLTALHPASFRPCLTATSLLLANDSGLTHVDLTQAALIMDLQHQTDARQREIKKAWDKYIETGFAS